MCSWEAHFFLNFSVFLRVYRYKNYTYLLIEHRHSRHKIFFCSKLGVLSEAHFFHIKISVLERGFFYSFNLHSSSPHLRELLLYFE